MKIMTILGTRPEIIRLCLIISKLDALCEHVILHTGQNYDPNLNDIFLEQLKVRTDEQTNTMILPGASRSRFRA